MQQCGLVYWCCLLLTLIVGQFGITSGFYIPRLKTSGPRRELDIAALRSRFHGSSDMRWNKRNGLYGTFMDSVSRHASSFDSKEAFFERLFELFDINENGCIDRLEFEVILDILVIFQ
ncbi:hypothetical protein KP79_PYT02132 [Mizuhopecten yessoensis]|uniref:EF-hand domain-containing protein n=1 Tax=Mizuhopecten yessoensis TaxID=6573 RepID=A0A210PZ01_MIZYE|nr:hypothetical protein KP79_PYT02132 [Mizuhopecten yessoensis]